MNQRPVLYHDIDGVLFGDYSGHFQLRPDVKGWLEFAHEHFEVVWLTTWTKEDIRQLLKILYCEKYVRHPVIKFRVADWYSYPSKEDWLSANKTQLDATDWVWIDDQIPANGRLIHLGIDPARCIAVNPKGADELVNLREELTKRATGTSLLRTSLLSR
jgi:hypothetical protein